MEMVLYVSDLCACCTCPQQREPLKTNCHLDVTCLQGLELPAGGAGGAGSFVDHWWVDVGGCGWFGWILLLVCTSKMV